MITAWVASRQGGKNPGRGLAPIHEVRRNRERARAYAEEWRFPCDADAVDSDGEIGDLQAELPVGGKCLT